MLTQPLSGITFDLDDTLYENWPVIRAAEDSLHRWFADNYPRIAECYSPRDFMELRHRVGRAHPELAHDLTALRKLTLAGAARHCDYDQSLVEPAFQVYYEARNRVTLFPETRAVLDSLAERYRLASLSNGNVDVPRIGLGDRFEFSLHAARVGFKKPHRAMFLEALARFGLLPRQVVHIGDDPDADVRGAAAVGMQTVWFNPGGVAWPGDDSPDAEVRSLDQLLDLLV